MSQPTQQTVYHSDYDPIKDRENIRKMLLVSQKTSITQAAYPEMTHPDIAKAYLSPSEIEVVRAVMSEYRAAKDYGLLRYAQEVMAFQEEIIAPTRGLEGNNAVLATSDISLAIDRLPKAAEVGGMVNPQDQPKQGFLKKIIGGL